MSLRPLQQLYDYFVRKIVAQLFIFNMFKIQVTALQASETHEEIENPAKLTPLQMHFVNSCSPASYWFNQMQWEMKEKQSE